MSNNDMIGSDHPLSAREQRRILAIVLDLIVPSEHRRVKGQAPSEVDVLGYIREVRRAIRSMRTTRTELDRLDTRSLGTRHGTGLRFA